MSRLISVVGLAVLATLAALCGCAGGNKKGPARAPGQPELILAHDDGRPSGTLAFPSATYESVVRFELPGATHRPLRLRLQAEAAGTIAVTIYENGPLETPGGELWRYTRDLGTGDLSTGRDGRWVTEDLTALPPFGGTVWIGVRSQGGAPKLWTSAVASSEAFIRDHDPQRQMNLLPVKRTPMIRLEVTP
jgi:hypothetical protein